jgi:hypothetical protein
VCLNCVKLLWGICQFSLCCSVPSLAYSLSRVSRSFSEFTFPQTCKFLTFLQFDFGFSCSLLSNEEQSLNLESTNEHSCADKQWIALSVESDSFLAPNVCLNSWSIKFQANLHCLGLTLLHFLCAVRDLENSG